MTSQELIAWLAIKGFKTTDPSVKSDYQCYELEINHIDYRFRFNENTGVVYCESKPMFDWQIEKSGMLSNMKVTPDGKLLGMKVRA